jgi:hypothetical protein
MALGPGLEGQQPTDLPEVDVQPADFVASGKAIGEGLQQSGFWDAPIANLINGSVQIASKLLGWALTYIFDVLAYFLRIILLGTNKAEDALAEVCSLTLDHLLGIEITAEAVKVRRDGKQTHPAVSQLGEQVMGQFLAAFSDGSQLQPDDAAAKKFVNRAVAMSVDGWTMDAVVDWIPHELLDFDKLASLDDKLRAAIGLGRMTRAVLHPALQILAVTPYEWKLNKQYRPKLLAASEAVQSFYRGQLTQVQMSEELARQGFSDDRIQALLNLHYPAPPVADIVLFVEQGTWTMDQALPWFQKHGINADEANRLVQASKLRQQTASYREIVNFMVSKYVNHDIDTQPFLDTMAKYIPDPDIRHAAVESASVRRENNPTLLSHGDAEQAFILGFWTVPQYTEWLQRKGFTDADVTTMQLLAQEKLREVSDAKKKRDDAAKARTAAAAARQAAALARQQKLQEQRAHKDLTLAAMHRAFVTGQVTLTVFHDFLVRDGQAPEDIQVLIELAQAERAAYQTAAAKRARAAAALQVTGLTHAQLEKAVEEGAITMDDYASALQQEGYSDSDIATLVKLAQTNIEARADAATRRNAIAAKSAVKHLSLSQMEMLVRHGRRTMAQFTAYLAAEGYTPEDQALLSGLLSDQLATDKAAAGKRAEVEAKLTHKNISLAALEMAVRRGIRHMQDYQAALLAAGINATDVQTLVQLLQVKINDDQAAAARKAAIQARSTNGGVALTTLERAARLGIVPSATYQAALAAAGASALDQEILLALLQHDIERTQLAEQHQAEAAAKLKNRVPSLADLKRGVELGIRTMADYQLALQTAGFNADAQELMASLLQDQIDMKKAAAERKAQLDLQPSEREVSRADFEKAVKQGIKTIDDYSELLQQRGYGAEDQAILVDLLSKQLG